MKMAFPLLSRPEPAPSLVLLTRIHPCSGNRGGSRGPPAPLPTLMCQVLVTTSRETGMSQMAKRCSCVVCRREQGAALGAPHPPPGTRGSSW